MNNPIYKILGKRGRITIPFEIRQRMGFAFNDILSFTEQDNSTIIVRREKICDGSLCRDCCGKQSSDGNSGITLLEFLDSLNPNEQRAALIHLSVKWAQSTSGDGHE